LTPYYKAGPVATNGMLYNRNLYDRRHNVSYHMKRVVINEFTYYKAQGPGCYASM
jgi:hypothetical protein